MIYINKIVLNFIDNDGVMEVHCVGCEDNCLLLYNLRGEYLPEGICVKKDEVEDGT